MSIDSSNNIKNINLPPPPHLTCNTPIGGGGSSIAYKYTQQNVDSVKQRIGRKTASASRIWRFFRIFEKSIELLFLKRRKAIKFSSILWLFGRILAVNDCFKESFVACANFFLNFRQFWGFGETLKWTRFINLLFFVFYLSKTLFFNVFSFLVFFYLFFFCIF